MKTNRMRKIAFAAAGFAAASAAAMAADFTWTGGGSDDNWTTAGNWGGVAPGQSQTLIFSGANRLTPFNNNAAGWNVFGIRFNADAGAFTLSGNSITLSVGVTNNSGNEQILDLGITMSGNLIFNTSGGDIVSNKGISGSGLIRKEGLGTLTLGGANAWTGGVYHLGGGLVYDYAGAGTFPTTGAFYFGAVGATNLGNTASLELKGNASISLPGISAGTYTHASSKIKLGPNVSATVASLTLAGNGTTNFDLTAAGSSVAFTASPALNNGLLLRGTVTNSGGTDFATVVGGALQRFTAFDGALVGGFADTKNYTLSGTQAIGASNSNSVTITGGGSLTTAGTSGLWTRALLMREGVADFTLNTVVRTTGPLFIHQYSTTGALILNERIHDADAAQALIKAGPGDVEITSNSISSYTGATYVQEGLLQVDGQLTRTATVTVFDGATLSGAGTIGSTSPTALTVRGGGTFAGTTSESLVITGTLTMESLSKFEFTLNNTITDHIHATGTVTLQSNVSLQLAFDGLPVLDTPIYLLTSDVGITGSFVYDGIAMSDGSAFTFGGYDFTYFQNANDIWIVAIPEPSAGILFGVGIAALLLRRRGREA